MAPLIGIAAILLVIIAAGRYLKYKRKKELERLAFSSGWSFDKRAAGLPDFETGGLPALRRGYPGEFSSLVTGAGAGDLFLVEYTYITRGSSGRRGVYKNFTLALFLLQRELPQFEMHPADFAEKLDVPLDARDIEITAFPLFSKLYKVTGREESPVRAFFTSRLTAFLERNPRWRIQADGRTLMAFKDETLVPVADYPLFVEEVRGLAAAMDGR